jgi:GNAT superfamily N-acetyltransferase
VSKEFEVVRIVTPEEIQATLPVLLELRPHLRIETFGPTVARMIQSGYRLVAGAVDGRFDAVAGYRVSECLAWGKYLYIDDLVTREAARSSGFGRRLLTWLEAEAAREGCREVHLDSGVQRHGAHRFYLRERMDITAYHFRRALP